MPKSLWNDYFTLLFFPYHQICHSAIPLSIRLQHPSHSFHLYTPTCSSILPPYFVSAHHVYLDSNSQFESSLGFGFGGKVSTPFCFLNIVSLLWTIYVYWSLASFLDFCSFSTVLSMMGSGDESDLNVVSERDSDFTNSPRRDLGNYMCFIYAYSDSSVCPLFIVLLCFWFAP